MDRCARSADLLLAAVKPTDGAYLSDSPRHGSTRHGSTRLCVTAVADGHDLQLNVINLFQANLLTSQATLRQVGGAHEIAVAFAGGTAAFVEGPDN